MTRHYDARTFTSAGSIGYLLKLSHSLMHDVVAAAFAGHDVSFVQWLVLMKLHEGTAVTSSDLCRQMSHDTGALTRLLDQLEERGYITRERSQEDRRVVELHVTAAGRRKIAELVPLAVDRLNTSLAPLSKTEFAELKRLLHKLIDGLRASGQPSSSGDAR